MKIYLLLSLSCIIFLSSCNLFIKTFVNKKYPPLPLDKIRDSTLRYDIKLDENIVPNLGIGIQDSITTFLSQDLLKKALKKNPNLNLTVVDSIIISDLKFQSAVQSCQADLRAQAYFNSNQKLKAIKCIDIDFSGFVFPVLENTRLNLNPALNHIHIRKVRFKNFFARIFSHPIKYIVESFINDARDNVNQIVSQAHVNIVDSLFQNVAISSFLKDEHITILHDDTLKLKLFFNNIHYMIDQGRISCVANLDDHATPNNVVPLPSFWLNKDVINYLNDQYNYKYNTVWSNGFDSLSNQKNITAVNWPKIEYLVNTVINKTNFSFRYIKDDNKAFDPKHLKIVNNIDCRILKGFLDCRGEWDHWWCALQPEICAFNFAACESKVGLAVFNCINLTKFIADFLNNVGTVGGDASLHADPICSVSNISLQSGKLGLTTNIFTNSSIANVNLYFDRDNSLPGVLICAIKNNLAHFSETISVNQTLTPIGSYEIIIQGDTNFAFHLSSEPLTINLNFSPSIVLSLIKNYQILLSCSLVSPLLILTTALDIGASPIICAIDPGGNACAFSQAYLDAIFNSFYAFKVDAQDKTLPIAIPKYTVNNRQVAYKLGRTSKYLSIEHLFP